MQGKTFPTVFIGTIDTFDLTVRSVIAVRNALLVTLGGILHWAAKRIVIRKPSELLCAPDSGHKD